MTPEFALIQRHFIRGGASQADRLTARHFASNAADSSGDLGIGDDCALFTPSPGLQVAMSTDTLVCQVHFFADVSPASLGHKALAVNLSDLAAMGAAPRYFTLALTLPAIDDVWLAAFADGMFRLADDVGIRLIGGDTTRGPLAINVTVIGEVAAERALRRDRAQIGDDIWISGDLGGAAAALNILLGEWRSDTLPAPVAALARKRLEMPTPRIALGRALVSQGLSRAAIDISDGLLADLGHIASRSDLSAVLQWMDVPLHASLSGVTQELQMQCALAGGDDYELCFAASVGRREAISQLAVALKLPLTRIGSFRAHRAGDDGARVVVIGKDGMNLPLARPGFDHFEVDDVDARDA